MEETVLILVTAFSSFVLMGFVGALLGGTRDRDIAGFFLGGFFGPIGWLIALLLPYGGGTCPECRNSHPSGANMCAHCGQDLTDVEEKPTIKEELSETIDISNLDITEESVEGYPHVVLKYTADGKTVEKKYLGSLSPENIAKKFMKELQTELDVDAQ